MYKRKEKSAYTRTFGKNRMFFGAFVGVHCVSIMNVVWDKRAEGLETRAGAVKIYPLMLFLRYAEINTCFFPRSNNKAMVIFRNIFMATAGTHHSRGPY